MTVLPCACGDRLTRALLGGRAPGPTPPRRVVPPLPPTRPGGGSASRKAGGAWCPRRPTALRPLGWEGPRPWRPKGRPGVPWRRAPPGPRVRTREVSRRPPTRDNRLDPQATACATVSHGTDLPASRRGNPGSRAVSRASPRLPRPPPASPAPVLAYARRGAAPRAPQPTAATGPSTGLARPGCAARRPAPAWSHERSLPLPRPERVPARTALPRPARLPAHGAGRPAPCAGRRAGRGSAVRAGTRSGRGRGRLRS